MSISCFEARRQFASLIGSDFEEAAKWSSAEMAFRENDLVARASALSG
jgi:hypothetical protein